MREAIFLSSAEVWRRGHGLNHPLKPERLQRTHELLAEYGALLLPNVRVVPPRLASEPELALFHEVEYIAAVRALSQEKATLAGNRAGGRYGFGPGDNPVFPGMYDSERLKVGSALQGAELLVDGAADVVFSYSGGLHHGGSNRASGFCVFNDAAVAIHWLLAQELRVAYVDIDVHHGDGVQKAFYNSDQVLTISLHQDGQTLFPGTGFVSELGAAAGAGYSVNVPLPPLINDESYLWAFEQIVPPLLSRFAADIVVTQLGVDTHFLDPLANLQLTTVGHVALFRILADLAPRWLALGGGGYDISVVPRSWSLAFGIMAGVELPDELPIAYRSRYGGAYLRDQETIRLEPAMSRQIRGRVESVVEKVRQVHHIA